MNNVQASTTSSKVAVITGAGTGIGAAIAQRLAALGWRVVLGGRTPSTLNDVAEKIVASGGQADVVVCDVTQAHDVERLINAASSRLDAIIHSAGIGHCLTIDEIDEAEFKRTLDVAVMGAFLTTKYGLAKLRATTDGAGYIMQICSLASGGTWFREVGYGTAKGAQLKFALHLASQCEEDAKAGGRKIHVHAVCPGTVATPFWNRVPNRPIDTSLALTADEVAWMAIEIIKNPYITHVELSLIKPRKEIVIKPHAPFERWPNVIAIAHESHP